MSLAASIKLFRPLPTLRRIVSPRIRNSVLQKCELLSVNRSCHWICQDVKTCHQYVQLKRTPLAASLPHLLNSGCFKFRAASSCQNCVFRGQWFCTTSQNCISHYTLPWKYSGALHLASDCQKISISSSLLFVRSQTLANQITRAAEQTRYFHTSPRNNIHPLLLIVFNYGARFASIIGGRYFRKWWQSLTPVEKQKYKDHILRRRQFIAAAVAVLILACLVHYYQHLELTPVTNRRRYIPLTPKQYMQIAQFELAVEYEAVKTKIVPIDDAAYKIVVGIVRRLVNANQDLDFFTKQNWTVILVDNDEANAAVLPTGHIFVNTGMLKLAQNEDQLAIVLGHEMAHALLNHGGEMISYSTVLDVVVIAVMAAIWAFMPSDGIAIVTDWFYKRVIHILLQLPYSRKLELEADEVGLQLTAKGCYDIREGPVFWKKMDVSEINATEIPHWISTHPASDFRAEFIDSLVPKAIKLRESCNCQELPSKDPRVREAPKFLVLDRNKSKDEAKN